ncbi:MAG: rhodanese-like domain-containing protein [Candidatus Saccharibacteria bacterium]
MIIYIAIAVAIIFGYMIIKNQGQNFSLEQLAEDLSEGGVLVDVRSASEFQSGHAKGAENVTLQAIQSGTMPSNNKQKPVYLYCHSGARAASASSLLKRAGYEHVINIGSLTRWRKMGGKVVS